MYLMFVLADIEGRQIRFSSFVQLDRLPRGAGRIL